MNTTTLPNADFKINARLGTEAAAQLGALMRKTGLSMSEIVRASLAHYHEAVVLAGKPRATSRIASMAGRYESRGADTGRLSSDYKQMLGEGLAAKHGATQRPAQ
jgi:Ribbon-helix-helix protein, copG family